MIPFLFDIVGMRVCVFSKANKRKQAASTNQKRLDLFTPGVVANFAHQENLQNLTYYQSIQMERMGMILRMVKRMW